MQSTTDFKTWLAGTSRPQTDHELFALWQASLGRSCGPYKSMMGPQGQTYISGWGDTELVLPSVPATAAFKRSLEAIKVNSTEPTILTEIEANQMRFENPDRVNTRGILRITKRWGE